MKRYPILVLIAAAVVVGCVSDDEHSGPIRGTFDDKQTGEEAENPEVSPETTSLKGRVDAERRTAVFVTDSAGDRHQVLSGEDGTFELHDVAAGEANFVLNDGAGFGAVNTVTLVPGGMNDVGMFSLQLLEGIRDVLGLGGAGLEERVTDGDGNYRYAVYSSERSKVYTAHRFESEPYFDIVEIDTATGAQRTLLEETSVNSQSGYLADEKFEVPFVLVGDRFLWMSRNSVNYPESIVIDVVSGDIVFDSAGTGYTAGLGPVVHGDSFFMLLETDIAINAEYQVGVYQYELHEYDTARGTTRSYGVVNPEYGEQPRIVGVDDNRIVITYRSCRHLASTDDAELALQCGGFALPAAVVLERPSAAVAGRYDHEIAVYDPSEEAAYGYRRDSGQYGVFRVDLRTGAETFVPSTTDWGITVYAVVDGRALVQTPGAIDNVSGPWMFVDVEAGTATKLDTSFNYDGQPFDICGSPHACEPTILDDGSVRLADSSDPNAGRLYVINDYDDMGLTNQRIFEIDDDTFNWQRGVAKSPASDIEALAVHRETDGFAQLLLGDPATGYVARTYIAAHHRHVSFTDDGNHLLYFTDDPFTGHSQLYRLEIIPLSFLP